MRKRNLPEPLILPNLALGRIWNSFSRRYLVRAGTAEGQAYEMGHEPGDAQASFFKSVRFFLFRVSYCKSAISHKINFLKIPSTWWSLSGHSSAVAASLWMILDALKAQAQRRFNAPKIIIKFVETTKLWRQTWAQKKSNTFKKWSLGLSGRHQLRVPSHMSPPAKLELL